MATSKKSAEVIDLKNLPEGGGSKFRVPEGDYLFKVKSVSLGTSQAGKKMFTWEFVGVEGKVKGKVLKEYTSLAPNALWKLRDVIEAITGRIPGAADVKKLLQYCKKLVGKEVGITLEDDEFTNDKGKTSISSKASDFISTDDLDGEPDDDDEDAEDDDDVEEEEDEDDEGDGLDEMDRKELKAHIKDEELDVAVKKSWSDDDIREAIRAASGDEDDEDDEEEVEDVDLDEL